ncbi:MAG: sporulation integral membrane protein YlbJ [Ignavibacteriales bacterium]
MKPGSIIMVITLLLMFVLFMIIEPRTTLEASRTGVNLWFETVLPALFPFFVACDLMMGLGIVKFLGTLLEPIMRPIFRLPGSASFVVAMGFTSGFPVGAVLTRELYEQKELTGPEAERLVCFTNNASPLFILGVVGVGLFHSAAIGYLLAFSHYLSNFLVGVISGRLPKANGNQLNKPRFTINEALAQLASTKQKSIGLLLGEAIKKSLGNIMAVGGFIVVFSVVTSALSTWGATDLISGIFSLAGISYTSGQGLSIGLFEMTLGSKALALSTGTNLEKILAVSATLAWSGFSIQAQIMSIVGDAPIRYAYYIKNRLLQAVLSVIISYGSYVLVFEQGIIDPVFQSLNKSPVIPQTSSFIEAALLGLLFAILMLTALSLAGFVYSQASRSSWNSL